MASGVPVEGEAGMGYVLNRQFDVPPIMFTKDEIEALAIAARISKTWAGSKLAHSTELALAKIEAVMPEALKAELSKPRVYTPSFLVPDATKERLDDIRNAINSRHIITIEYHSLNDETTNRTLHPLGLFFWGKTWTLATWCELRQDYRSFRVDRINDLKLAGRTFQENSEVSLNKFLESAHGEALEGATFLE
jgi:predicted DNA-binding transcriptional regulator YafY